MIQYSSGKVVWTGHIWLATFLYRADTRVLMTAGPGQGSNALLSEGPEVARQGSSVGEGLRSGNARSAKCSAYARRLWVLRLSNGGFSDAWGPRVLSLLWWTSWVTSLSRGELHCEGVLGWRRRKPMR